MRYHLCCLPVLAALSSGCSPNDTGFTKATTKGDTANPLAPDERADAELTKQCGDVKLADERTFSRLPYLQRMTTQTVTVMWAEASAAHRVVEVTTPDGKVMTRATARRDSPGMDDGTVSLIAKVKGLKADTVYCYAIKDDAERELAGRIGFRTAPAKGSGAATRLAVFGDSGDGSADQEALVKTIPTVPFDFILHVGDMAYSTGTAEEFQAHYFDVYEDILTHFAVFPVPGNHEYQSGDAEAYRAAFDLPNNERYYSFDWGDVHFVGLDTEQMSEEQTAWLAKDLKATQQPWKVAFLHKGPYSSGWHGSDDEVQESFSPLFERHGVQLVLSGHDHDYERIKPQNGVQYIVTGGGGAGTYPIQPQDFSAFALEVVHFLYVTIDDGELAVHAIDASGQEFDQVVIDQ